MDKKLSIITINYNNCNGLRRTVESIKKQTCKDFEYIIIDGGSTDGSIEVIEEYKDVIDYWVSEPDKGIYNAMNKGVLAANCEYLNFLNSGDYLNNDDVIFKLNSSLKEYDIMVGNTQNFHVENDNICLEKIDYAPKEVTCMNFIFSSISHQSAIIKRRLLINNPYDENLKIVSDWKFYLKELVFNNRSYYDLNFIIANFDTTGCSNTNRSLALYEREKILNEYFPKRILIDYFNMYYGITDLEKCMFGVNKAGVYYRLITNIAIFLKKIIHLIK